jgi:hypothetical protein
LKKSSWLKKGKSLTRNARIKRAKWTGFRTSSSWCPLCHPASNKLHGRADRGKQPFLQVSYNAKFVTGNQNLKNRRRLDKIESLPTKESSDLTNAAAED